MTIKILSPETHVSIAVVSSAGEIIAWQAQPFFTLADLYPANVKWLQNRTSLQNPGAEETLRNIRVFSGCVYMKLSELDEQAIKDGNTTLLVKPLTVTFPDGSQEVFTFNSLWSSATKNHTLTGYTAKLDTALRKVFNYAEAGVRVGRGTRGGFSSGKVKEYPIQWLPQDELLTMPKIAGFDDLIVGDGEFFIRASDAVILRRALTCKPFSLNQWRFSPQIASQIKRAYDQEGMVLELAPHVAEAIERINTHDDFIAHAQHLDMQEASAERLVKLSEEMLSHSDLNLSLSPDRARMIFDAITTGRPKSIQGFVAIAGTLPGTVVFPSKQTRFLPSDLYLLARYPVNNSRCIMPAVAVQQGPISDFLNEIEQFQGTLFGKDSSGSFMAAGQFIVIPDEFWPMGYAGVKIIACSKNIKANSTWKSADDVKVTQGDSAIRSFIGYISVCQWAHKGNAAMIDAATWKESNGDFDFDEGEAIPEVEFPMTFEAFRQEWMVTAGMAISKLPKIYSFDEPDASRVKTLQDTLAGAIAVGLAANNNLLVLNSDPARWPIIAQNIGSDGYFALQMVAKGYITEAYPPELIAWFEDICGCDEACAKQVIRLFYVMSFHIQCGVDGFKTNLDNLGGMKGLVKSISQIWRILTEDMGLSQRLIDFNPKKSPTALRDANHLPEFGPDEVVYGVSETLMKMSIEGFAWDGLMYKLQLPDYLYLGAYPDSFKFYAVMPHDVHELEAARLLRRMCRDELARRSMTTPAEWALFNRTFWTPLLVEFQKSARIILRYDRKMVDGKAVYSVAKERKFPSMVGITWERIAHLLWYAFHDTAGKVPTGSALPLFWVEPIREHLFALLADKPGQIDDQDEFHLAIIGTDKAGIERDHAHVVELKIERVLEDFVVAVDPKSGEDVLLTVERSRNIISFADGRYVMIPKDGPLLSGSRFTLTITRIGNRDIGHFVRLIPVSGVDLAARLAELKAMFP